MYKKWTEQEIQYLKENYGKIKLEELKLEGRTETAIRMKAKKLKLVGYNRWSKEDEDYLMDIWGYVSIVTIAKNLGRSENAVILKARRMGLGSFLESGDYVTLNQFYKALRGYNYNAETKNSLIEKGLPVKKRKVNNNSFMIIYLDEWWDWAERNMNLIDLSRLEPLALGKEPEWVEEKRKADIEKNYFKTDPWTPAEDELLIKLLNMYRYTYRDLSLRLRRTEGAIKRRMCDLNIKARPLKMSNHNPWTKTETKKLIDLYHKGYSPDTMANYIPRSAQACRGKIERLIKEGILQPRSEYRKTC